MRHSGKTLTTLLLLLPLILFSCNKNIEGIIIVTRLAGSYSDTISPERDMSSSRIGIFNPDKPAEGIKILTKDFFSANAPDISFDGKRMLFSGKKSKEDPWQIWEMDLAGMKSKAVTSKDENCIDPAYLPADRLVFSKLMVNDSLKSHYSLFVCNSDGSGQDRITFTPSLYRSSTVLADGRILAICEKVYPVRGKTEMMVLRPDGTKAELFTGSPALLHVKPLETVSKIVFTKNENGNVPATRTISYNRPFHSETPLVPVKGGEFLNGMPYAGEYWIVCYRKTSDENFGLYQFDKEGNGKQLFIDPEWDVIHAVATGVRPVPKKLPSEVDKLVKTGLLLCQDVKYNGPSVKTGDKKTLRIEVTGLDAEYGKIEPEQDGSVYLKVIADMPFRISTLDENGHVISTCNWMSLRPNERRGCTGCHEDPETVPQNRLPFAVKKAPAIIPVHIEKITEKIVELE